MIYSVNGTLIYKDEEHAVIECGGVGYNCVVSTNTLSKLPKIGEKARLLTNLYIKEDSVTLIGFFDSKELEAFKLLRTVNGVGVKSAVAILSYLTPEKLALAIVSDDLKSITKAPGIGKKVGQRIILELKDKMKNEDVSMGIAEGATNNFSKENVNVSEAIDALTVLGYEYSDIVSVVSKFPPEMSTEEIIKTALKKLVKFSKF